MHVVHLYDGHEQVYEGKGSVPTVVWQFARETATRDHDVTVVERRWADLARTAVHEGVSFERIDPPTGPEEPWTRVPYEQVTTPTGFTRLVGDRTVFAGAAFRTLRRLDPDVIHVHLPFAANVLATAAPWLRERMVYTAHLGELRLDLLEGDADGDVPGLLSVFSPDVYLARRAARTTVLNPSIERAFRARNVPDERLTVVPNGVDLDRFQMVDADERDRIRATYGLDTDRPVVLFVGTIMPRKGVTDLVEAVADLEEDTQVILAGETDLDDEYVRTVETLIRENELTENVRMVGFVPGEDLAGLYAVADVFALPSHEEGFGMTAVEALAAGTPVVGTQVGGLPEFIDESVGSLVDVGDTAGLRDGICKWLTASAEDVSAGTASSEDVSARCRERASAYSWPGVCDQIQALYDEVVQ